MTSVSLRRFCSRRCAQQCRTGCLRYPGGPQTSGWLEGLNAALQTGKYDYVLMAPNVIGNIMTMVNELESAMNKDFTVIGFGTFGEALTSAMNATGHLRQSGVVHVHGQVYIHRQCHGLCQDLQPADRSFGRLSATAMASPASTCSG